MHRSEPILRKVSVKRWVSVFGWGSLSGLLLPALLLVGFVLHALSGATEQDKLREAHRVAWVDNDWGTALVLYQQLLEEHPGGVTAPEAYVGSARAMENLGRVGRKVADAYDAAARLSLQREARGRYLLQSGNHRLADGQEMEAALRYNQVIRERSEASQEARLALGRLLLAQGAVDEALEHFQVLSQSEQSQVSALGRFGISISYERLGDLDSAIAQLDEEEASASSERLERLFERRSAFSR